MTSPTKMDPFSTEFTKRLKRRYRAQQRFKIFGLGAIFIALAFLVFLLTTIIGSGYGAFRQAFVQLDVSLDQSFFPEEDLAKGDF
ncbi:MAG: DUF3333 domain-containing protein, partial [Desulfocapsaceae bacterium]